MEDKSLYVIATPIGNLADITFRAIDTLKAVDVVLCEDTRHSRRLLDHYQIEKKLISLHQHSSEEKIKQLLADYRSIGYITDAGTPGISDPGGKLVELAYENDFSVSPIPGPSAVISALSVSGFPTDKFLFLGFMPHKGKGKTIQQIADSDVATAFYESPHRIIKTLEQLRDGIGGDRKIVVARELTKKFETIYRGKLEALIVNQTVKAKGEFVVVVAPR